MMCVNLYLSKLFAKNNEHIEIEKNICYNQNVMIEEELSELTL